MGLTCTQLLSDTTRQILLSKPAHWGSFVHWNTMKHEEQTSRTRWTRTSWMRWTLQDSHYLPYHRTFWHLTALKFNGKLKQFTFKHKRTLLEKVSWINEHITSLPMYEIITINNSLTLHMYIWPAGLSKKSGGHHSIFASLKKSKLFCS